MSLIEVGQLVTLSAAVGLAVVAGHEYATRLVRWWRGNSER